MMAVLTMPVPSLSLAELSCCHHSQSDDLHFTTVEVVTATHVEVFWLKKDHHHEPMTGW